jgi:hypothetical protein
MIKNERQYALTRSQADKFAHALEELAGRPTGNVPPRLRKAEEDALRSQLDELREEVAEYERLRAGRAAAAPVTSLAELPQALIRARIAQASYGSAGVWAGCG